MARLTSESTPQHRQGGPRICRHQRRTSPSTSSRCFASGTGGPMTFLFDLWDYEAVRENAEAILAATEGGDMPCDGAWPEERVALLRRWIEGGCQP